MKTIQRSILLMVAIYIHIQAAEHGVRGRAVFFAHCRGKCRFLNDMYRRNSESFYGKQAA